MGFLLAGNGLLVVFLTIMVYKKVSPACLTAQQSRTTTVADFLFQFHVMSWPPAFRQVVSNCMQAQLCSRVRM